MTEIVRAVVDQAALLAVRAAVSAAVFVAFWLAGITCQRIIRRIGDRSDLSEDILGLMERTAKGGLLLLGAASALGTAGIDVSALVAGLGLTGFALGFALRDILSNLLAGVLILIYRPFQRKDRVSVAGFEGSVIDIDRRYTTLQAQDKKILIPNSTLFSNAVSVFQSEK